jgi:diphthamide biosynthesis protein 2
VSPAYVGPTRKLDDDQATSNEFSFSSQKSTMSSSNSQGRPSAPQLVFDDGSRVMTEEAIVSSSSSLLQEQSRPSDVSISEYYEIDRLVREIRPLLKIVEGDWSIRIALQFPDELLSDAPDVIWGMEKALEDSFVFCLGDTTFASCCPDYVAAAHLQADCLVHFGHACLSHTQQSQIPVFYSFGKTPLDINACVSQVLAPGNNKRLLLLYQVTYHHAMEELQTRLSEQGDLLVVAGELPPTDCACSTEEDGEEENIVVIGGLQLPKDMDWSTFTLLYIGDTSSRQYLNLILRFLSSPAGPPEQYLTWHNNELLTSLSPAFQRQLNRRFYLVEKARTANVIGILVGNLDERMRSVVTHLANMLDAHGRDSYTFVVGKITPSKLANFGEVDCYCLVACPEHALLMDDKEVSVPVITPLEMCMALNVIAWGATDYSLDAARDFLKLEPQQTTGEDDADDDDAPFYSLVTGRYEGKPAAAAAAQQVDLTALPGQGQLTAYTSAAADFLKQREYKGLEVLAGESQVQAASQGQQGIASSYDGGR